MEVQYGTWQHGVALEVGIHKFVTSGEELSTDMVAGDAVIS